LLRSEEKAIQRLVFRWPAFEVAVGRIAPRPGPPPNHRGRPAQSLSEDIVATNPLSSEAVERAEQSILEAEKNVRELTDRVEKLVQEGLEKLRTHGKVYAEDAERSLEAAQKYVTEQVQERPVATTLAAIGLGVLVGLLLGGRRR
jgi:ElaB/YqjD/DUF883 family membrane-anchored ribosome-binding protein